MLRRLRGDYMSDFIVACSGVIPTTDYSYRPIRFYENKLPPQEPQQVVCQEQRLTEANRPSIFEVYDNE
jgi:hypothetical protein